jgi:RHS repeat-associated protein
MRKDDEIHGATGTSYDFGARIYDPRVGRFLSLDPYSSKFPGESPYLFAGDNPIYYIDKNGEYKLPTALQAQYPKLTNMVKNLETIMKSNHGVWEAFKSNMGLTEEQATSIVRWDSGPELSVRPMVNKVGKVQFGETSAPDDNGNVMVALSEIMVQTMEGQHQSEAITPEGAAALTFITLGHEGQHAGEPLVNDGKFLPKRKGEQGYKFENKAFGKEYGTDNYKDFGTDQPGLYERVLDGSVNQVDRMQSRPTRVEAQPLPDRKPVE